MIFQFDDINFTKKKLINLAMMKIISVNRNIIFLNFNIFELSPLRHNILSNLLSKLDKNLRKKINIFSKQVN